MKEKFFYLEQKYGVRLLVNNKYDQEREFIFTLFGKRIFKRYIYLLCRSLF